MQISIAAEKRGGFFVFEPSLVLPIFEEAEADHTLDRRIFSAIYKNALRKLESP